MIRLDPVPFPPARAPSWARPSGSLRDLSEAEALFFAGAALSALDSVAKSEPPWAGAWRARLALKSAAAVAQTLLKRHEDGAALRDAVALAKPGQDLGPAGRVYALPDEASLLADLAGVLDLEAEEDEPEEDAA